MAGRFISIDPLWGNYYGWTPYQYSMNSPVMLVDIYCKLVENQDGSIKYGTYGATETVTHGDEEVKLQIGWVWADDGRKPKHRS